MNIIEKTASELVLEWLEHLSQYPSYGLLLARFFSNRPFPEQADLKQVLEKAKALSGILAAHNPDDDILLPSYRAFVSALDSFIAHL